MIGLFSVENEYDQPSNNLVCLWKDKPSLEECSEAIGIKFPAPNDDMTLALVKVWNGEDVCIHNTNYRLQEVKFDEVL
jgi:hypothetical protein